MPPGAGQKGRMLLKLFWHSNKPLSWQIKKMILVFCLQKQVLNFQYAKHNRSLAAIFTLERSIVCFMKCRLKVLTAVHDLSGLCTKLYSFCTVSYNPLCPMVYLESGNACDGTSLLVIALTFHFVSSIAVPRIWIQVLSKMYSHTDIYFGRRRLCAVRLFERLCTILYTDIKTWSFFYSFLFFCALEWQFHFLPTTEEALIRRKRFSPLYGVFVWHFIILSIKAVSIVLPLLPLPTPTSKEAFLSIFISGTVQYSSPQVYLQASAA